MTPASLDLKARLVVATDLARQVGRAANAFRATADDVALQVQSKGLQDFVSVADRQAAQTIRAEVAAHFPADGFMGDGAQSGQATRVVDPIDGTTNFIRDLRHWGVSLAVFAAGKVQIGVFA
ncbi:MAG: inositol monophosphatase family protein [Cypionkella sp.]